MTWNESSDEVLDFSREPGFRCIVNFGAEKVTVDADAVIASSIPLDTQGKTVSVGRDQAVWLRVCTSITPRRGRPTRPASSGRR